MSKVQAFTPTTIAALKDGKMSDPRTPGLSIETKAGGKVWRYYRRVKGSTALVRLTLGGFPAFTLADARVWAEGLNERVERGENPVEEAKALKAESLVTFDFARDAYIKSLEAGIRKTVKPRTITDKKALYKRDIQPFFGTRAINTITPDDLWERVEEKGETAPVRANRLAAELKVFFKWCVSREGLKAGIKLAEDPATSLNGKYFSESKGRERFLDTEEIGWFLKALSEEVRFTQSNTYRRAFMLWLLTACRHKEVIQAPASEYQNGVWHIPGARTKNSDPHTLPLGPWGQSLMQTNGEYIIEHRDGGLIRPETFYHVRDRLHVRMEELAGRKIDSWTMHDLRRTFRSNTFDLNIRYEVAEAILNHTKKGLDRRYDQSNLLPHIKDALLVWENHIVALAVKAGVAEALGVPAPKQ